MRHINFTTRSHIVLALIVALAVFLFTYRLDSVPPGLYIDEAGTGYNAFSILHTGKDEYGKSLPIAMRLFGSYSPPLYVYLSVPIMYVFGLSVFSTRLLSAICGVGAVITVYFIIKDFGLVRSKYTPLVSTLFFAITPWIVFYSRVGYEQSLAFLAFAACVLMVHKTIANPKLMVVTVPLLSLATYTDYPQRFVAPLLCVWLAWSVRKALLRKANLVLIGLSVGVAALIQIPNLFVVTTPSFYTKADHLYTAVVADQAGKIASMVPTPMAYTLAFVRELTSKFTTFYSPRSLFFEPDPDLQRSMPGLSVLYPWMVIPYLIGLAVLWQSRNKPAAKLVFVLALITPLPGALTKEPFHIQRTLPLLLPLTCIVSMGIDWLIVKRRRAVWLTGVVVLVLSSLLFLWRSYFILLPHQRGFVWGGGFAQLAQIIKDNPDKTFVIDQSKRTQPKDVAYIQMAFYLQLDPKLLHADQDPGIVANYYTQTEFSFIHKFANVETKGIEWGETQWRDIILVGDTVSISDPEVKLHNLTQVFEIKDPNQNVLFRGFQTNPTVEGKN